MNAEVFLAETQKSIPRFIKDLGKAMAMQGFMIHNEDRMEMVHHFGHHGVDLADGFDLHMVQVCAPKKSAQSLMKNLERAVLLPRYIVVFSKDGKTQVRMLQISDALVAQLVDDAEFPAQHVAVCESLVLAIKEAL
ncbi:protein of unknown function DUF302 [Desulfuromusa kysingii]|uniref:DUF302 domain-containing protein n=1 Tax=Desulfuromusa kysingii TaxID=37625 RepID=A0A1H3X1V7_9BACT|nr:DUF302 domain-containing protein [Desulfuromusa kysingii]SDZ93379.1 protein of unknown function DUF302 [Desulfuromusa kysingii]